MSPVEIAQKLGKERGAIRILLRRMEQKGEIRRTGPGFYELM